MKIFFVLFVELLQNNLTSDSKNKSSSSVENIKDKSKSK